MWRRSLSRFDAGGAKEHGYGGRVALPRGAAERHPPRDPRICKVLVRAGAGVHHHDALLRHGDLEQRGGPPGRVRLRGPGRASEHGLARGCVVQDSLHDSDQARFLVVQGEDEQAQRGGPGHPLPGQVHMTFWVRAFEASQIDKGAPICSCSPLRQPARALAFCNRLSSF